METPSLHPSLQPCKPSGKYQQILFASLETLDVLFPIDALLLLKPSDDPIGVAFLSGSGEILRRILPLGGGSGSGDSLR